MLCSPRDKLINLLRQIGNYSAVLTACRMALDLDADNVKALFRLGKAQAALGDRATGITCITKALMGDPENQVSPVCGVFF